MSTDYSYMDEWSEQQITDFKDSGIANEVNQIEIMSGVIKLLSDKKAIVAEGDSWFDYLPGTDLIDCLRKHHGYYINNFSKAGDTLENMIYGTGYNKTFQRTVPSIDKVLRKVGQLRPKVFLFSGGGNDIAGDEFASYINHKDSTLPILRTAYIDNMVNVVFKKYFEDLINKINDASPSTHILTHGYGHTLATGKGVGFLGLNFAGPWLKPALAMKGIFNLNDQLTAVKTMIDSYNEMLNTLDKLYNKFHYVDLRPSIDPYKDWENELHLKNSAYARVADIIHKEIIKI